MLGKNRRFWPLAACIGLAIAAERPAAGADDQSLAARHAPGDVTQVEVLLEVGGDLTVVDDKEKKVHALKMSVVGSMVYDEKRLPATGQEPGEVRSVRNYRRCDAVIKIDKGGARPRLRDDRRLVSVAGSTGRTTMFSPTNPLSREELDLIEIPASSLLVEQLLPDRPVSPGDEWQHSNDLVAALLNLDAVSECDVRSRFKEVTAAAAQLELAGTVHGATEGVSTEIELKGRYKFDLKARRITWVALLIKEKRPIGHVAPGVDVAARLQMKITPNVTGEALSDHALAGLILEPRPDSTLLEYESAHGGFRFLHDRGWHVVNEARDSVVLRLVDRGELVAQCNVTALPPVEPGKRLTLAKFQEDIERSLGKTFGRFESAGESVNAAGHHLSRVITTGEVEKLPIQWNYYLVADGRGHQVVAAFTLESALVDRFGTSDASILATLRFLANSADTAAQPTVAPARK